MPPLQHNTRGRPTPFGRRPLRSRSLRSRSPAPLSPAPLSGPALRSRSPVPLSGPALRSRSPVPLSGPALRSRSLRPALVQGTPCPRPSRQRLPLGQVVATPARSRRARCGRGNASGAVAPGAAAVAPGDAARGRRCGGPGWRSVRRRGGCRCGGPGWQWRGSGSTVGSGVAAPGGGSAVAARGRRRGGPGWRLVRWRGGCRRGGPGVAPSCRVPPGWRGGGGR